MLKHVLLQPCTFGGTIPWYEPSDNARNVLDQFPDFTFSHLEYEAYAWPGGYEISYIVKVAVTAFITDSEFRILGLNDDFGKPVIATTSCAMYPGNDVVREFINSKIKEKSCVAESAENLLS